MPVIEILNPQDPIPEVQSNQTIVENRLVDIDLNEDSWSKDYFIVIFHTGPNDPVSLSTLKALDKINETLPCQVYFILLYICCFIFDRRL